MKAEAEILIRPFEKESDYFKCEALQKETWGKDLEEVVTASLAKIVQKIGGIAAGAFNADGEMVGFVFGFTGFREGKPVHWSHMIAVKPAYRDAGIGKKLKLYQREVMLSVGVREIFWTYDPLASKNAHLNLNTLGAVVQDYVEDMYGAGEDSVLFRGIGTDRFIVVWRIAEKRVDDVLGEKYCFEHEPFRTSALAVRRTAESDPGSSPMNWLDLLDPRVRIEVPQDVYQLMNTSMSAAAEWRKKTREAFRHYLHRGYKVVGFYSDQVAARSFYCLERSE
jgi:predicted GNAT superfamily acetyltransferase